MKSLNKEIETIIEPAVKFNNRKGLSYGECSGLIYLTFDELYRRYRSEARFILLTRHPADFVKSALARGFFDPDHPYALEHIKARDNTEIGRQWGEISPFEKCLWYWNTVNGMVHNFFHNIPQGLWKIQPIEKLDCSACRDLYQFLGIEGFDELSIKDILSKRINATPGSGDDQWVNPYSRPINMADWASWEPSQKKAYKKWAEPLIGIFYPGK